jgi:hypothetical protein
VLSGRGLCNELITHPEESYRLWCVVVCDLETSRMRRPWPALGRNATAQKQKQTKQTPPERWYIRHKMQKLSGKCFSPSLSSSIGMLLEFIACNQSK